MMCANINNRVWLGDRNVIRGSILYRVDGTIESLVHTRGMKHTRNKGFVMLARMLIGKIVEYKVYF